MDKLTKDKDKIEKYDFLVIPPGMKHIINICTKMLLERKEWNTY